MNRNLFAALLCLCIMPLFAQRNVGIGLSNPHPSSIVDIYSPDKGLLIPRMHSAQRQAMATPWANGLLVFDIDSGCVVAYDSVSISWRNLCALSIGPSGVTGPQGATGAQGATGVTGPSGNDGATGPQGIAGPTGPQGIQGIQGPSGNDGATGPQGIAGPQGPTGAAGTPGTAGPQGPTGAAGTPGVAGPIGPQGIQGIQGPSGNDGATGPQGVAGPQGPTGAPGTPGAAGPQGPTGAAGTPGAAGPQGPTGTAGTPGVAGPTGPQGIQGIQGPSGNDGATGPQGVAGPQGPTGTAGTPGAAGPQGSTGAAGTPGVAGPTGPQGAQGIQGPSGNDGATGPQGIAGPQGPTGAAGTPGLAGPTGPQGIQGIQGPSGNDGATGPQGIAGPQGPTGAAGTPGAAGPQGPTGTAGTPGVAGPTGPQGIQGIQGPSGNDGATGPQGITGPQGPTGAAGTPGLAGPTGPQGIQGIQGPSGNDGATGPQGIAGPQGPTGAAGTPGAAGPQGPTGTAGTPGVAGPTGPQGIQGIQGPSGNDGVTGPQGITGLQGPTGAAGTTGVAGPTGPQGIQGPSGTDGATGAQGAQGIQGPTGAQGATGPTGPLGTAGGDLSGTYPNPTVAGLQTTPVSATAPATGQVLTYNGTQWAPQANPNWLITGNSNTTSPVVPATYGTSLIGGAENWIGTTGANDFTVGTNQIERMRILAGTGYVGIGIAAPTYPLMVRTSTATANARSASLANAINDQNFNLAVTRGATTNGVGDIMTQIGQAYGTGLITEGIQFIRGIAAQDGAMAFVTNNATERMRITSTGRVGIGTNAPGYLLDVAGRGRLRTGSGTAGLWYMNAANTSDNAFIGMQDDNHVGFWGNLGVGWGMNMDLTTGYVGIGTASPSRRLVVNNGTTNGAIQIVDGTQAAGYVLTSDASGVGTWQKTQVVASYSTLGAGVSVPYNTVGYLYTGTSITLPPGKYSVSVSMLMSGGTAPSNSSFWVRTTFADASNSTGPSPDIIGSNLASGGLIGPATYAMLNGSIIINNTSGSNKTYYYLAGNTVATGTTQTLGGFGGSGWGEDNIVAIKIQ